LENVNDSQLETIKDSNMKGLCEYINYLILDFVGY